MPLSEEQRRRVMVLGLLASLVGRMVEAIVAQLLVVESAGLARRVTVGLPREAMLRVLLMSMRRIVAALDAMVMEARAGLAPVEAGPFAGYGLGASPALGQRWEC